MKRLSLFWIVLLLLLPCALSAERVADLPMPTRYVNDFAGVVSPTAQQGMEQECRQLHDLAHADVAVVTIKQLEDGQTVEEFKVALEEKWKLGQKGSDRSAIYVLVLNPHRLSVETGYGLEGVLNDAKVGAILDRATPYARVGNYDAALEAGLDGIGQVIAQDAHVSIAPAAAQLPPPPVQRATPQQRSGGVSVVVGLIVLGFVLLMLVTGNGGVLFSILFSLMGNGSYGGGYGGGRDDDSGFGGGGGGFGGSGGGESGGGGASRDF